MKKLKKSARILLLVAFALPLLFLLHADTGEATYSEGEEWVCTPAALQKEQQGFCSSGVCRELCYFGQPTGFFNCFNH